MFRSLRYSLRLCALALILLPAWRSGRLARALERMGPSFIKLGQTLSTRADLLGDAVAADLATLRDRLPPFSGTHAQRIIESELGRPLSALYAEFTRVPVAAASIAQVHKAVLHDGNIVAVKVLRPGIEKAFARDLDLFFWIARVLERRFPAARRLRPLEVVNMLKESMQFELDLRFEAASIEEVAENNADDTRFKTPAIDWDRTAQRVLTTAWVEGIPLHDVGALRAAGHDLDDILAALSTAFFNQAFRDGFFHADLHPGNLFVDTDGAIVAVDFGIMGRLSRRTRLYVAEIFSGFLNEDYRRVAEAHFRAGYVPRHHSVEQFALACRAIAAPILNKPVQEVSIAGLLAQLFRVTEMFEMETRPELLLLQKTLVVVEGVGRLLNPNVNMWEMARAPIGAWAAANLGPRGRLQHMALDALDYAHDLPEILEAVRDALLKERERA